MRAILIGAALAAMALPALGATTLEKVVDKFADSGLEFENPVRMGPKDYGYAPYVCDGARFRIPSLGAGAGGRVFVCKNQAERDRLANYYRNLGKQSAAFFSWVFVKGGVVLQINGDLPEGKAKEYAATIPG